METTRSRTEAKLQEGRLPKPTKVKTKARHIHSPHKNTKRDPCFRQRKVQASSVNDNPGRKRNASKFCKFHGEVGLTTNECMYLKRQIKEMLKAAKQKVTQTFSPESVISFPPLGDEDGTEAPMIIKTEMGGHCVQRMYVDEGSSSEILYEHCFNRFHPEVRNQMIPATTPLVGFSGEIIWPLGQILLLVKIGDEEHSTSAWMNFMLVRSPFSYKGIIRRPWARRIQAVPSTAHGMLKFPVTGGTVTLQSSMIITLECTMVLGPGVPQPVINQVTEEELQVAIHPEYPEQTITIGSTLTEEGRKELCAEHRLNIREGCLPVRQKKKRQATERNKAICEEVEKLVDTDIMKEVHYHSWLSNPVMQMKKLIAELPMLVAPKEKEELIMYLAAVKEAISANLMTKREEKQMPIYIVSRALQGPKVNYTPMEKLILALVSASKRLKRYFQAHTIVVFTDQPIKRMLFNPEVAGRFLKWRFELEEHGIHYRLRTSVKGQILADFIMERPEDDSLDTPIEDKEELPDP
nr:reverse transcriptase domain-containing protein [Tanacetum cinerariifolium]